MHGMAKVILILINTISLLASLALIAFGVFVVLRGEDYIPDAGVDVNAIAYALIVLGVILLFVSLFGFFGACTGKHGLLNFYLILLGVVVALLVAALIYGFIMRSDVADTVETYITDSFDTVKNATSANATVDQFVAVNAIQVAVKCCGITGPEYWNWGGDVPSSCCANFTTDDATALCSETDAYTTACMESTEDLIQNALLAAVILIVVIVIFLVACMIFACCSKKGK